MLSLDYEELESSHAVPESEKLELPDEFPPEPVNEGTEKELASMSVVWSFPTRTAKPNYVGGTPEGYSD